MKGNERGFAVVTALILAGIVVLLISVGLYVYDASVRTTVLGERRNLDEVLALSTYRSAVEKIRNDRYLYNRNESSSENNRCFFIKVNYPTDEWSNASGWSGNCPSVADATSENVAGIEKYYDLLYKTPSGDKVYVKIVYSSEGNTTVGGKYALNVAGTPALSTGVQAVKPPPMPRIYKMDIIVVDRMGNTERFAGVYLY